MVGEHQQLRGRVTVRVVDASGSNLRHVVRGNEIVDSGRILIGRLLIGDPDAAPLSHLAVGADASPPEPSETALRAEINAVDRAPIEFEPLASAVGLRVRARLTSATEQGISEAGLFNAAEHGAGVMYNRVVFPSPLPLRADLDLIFEWDITFG